MFFKKKKDVVVCTDIAVVSSEAWAFAKIRALSPDGTLAVNSGFHFRLIFR
jgi:hypothetical protein